MVRFLIVAVSAILVLGGFIVLPDYFRKTDINELQRLRIENEFLKSKAVAANQELGNRLYVPVHAAYPFSDKSEITIAAGSQEGIRPGMPVLVLDRAVVGQVVKVFKKYSVVRTIFDSKFEIPVRVGAEGYQALLSGGPEARLTFIDKNALIKEGDVVYAAAKGFPYGAVVGSIRKVQIDSSSVFKKAVVAVPYQLNDIREVSILTEY